MRGKKARSQRVSEKSVYVFHSHTFGCTKVGVSVNPEARCKVFARLDWRLNDLRVIKAWQRAGDAYQIETLAHHMLSEHHARHEWFHCAPEVAVAVVDGIVSARCPS